MSTKALTEQNQNPFLRFVKLIWSEYSIILVTILIFTVAGLIAPRFVQVSNIMIMLRQASIIGVLSVGMTFVIITGGIDLSSGGVVTVAGAVLLILQGTPDMPLIVAILACFGAATVLGLINGLIITKFRVPAFIVTLAIGIIARSIALYLVDGQAITGNRVPEFTEIGTGSLGFMPNALMVWIVMSVIFGCVLKFTKYGSYTYAVGGNELASKYSGMSPNKIKIVAYGLTGFCAGLAALLDFSRMAAISVPTAGYLYEFDAITGVVVGGALLSGGRGKMLNTFFGVIIIMTIGNLMNRLEISPFLMGLVKGIVILTAVLLQKREK